MTKGNKEPAGSYIVFYDAECAICRRSRRLLERLKGGPSFEFVDVNDDRAMTEWPDIDVAAAQRDVTVLTPDRRQLAAYDAVVELLAKRFSLVNRARPALEAKPVRSVGQALYRLVSHNRYGIARVLDLDKKLRRKKHGFARAEFEQAGSADRRTARNHQEQPSKTETYDIGGMTCAACTDKIRSEVLQLRGVHEIKVDLDAATARVKYDPAKTSSSAVQEAITNAGYDIAVSGVDTRSTA